MMTELGFLQGTYTPLVHAHARRTQKVPADQQNRQFFCAFRFATLLHKKQSVLLSAEHGVMCKKKTIHYSLATSTLKIST